VISLWRLATTFQIQIPDPDPGGVCGAFSQTGCTGDWGVTKHRTVRTAQTALKYGVASCGDEYTPGNDHVGVN